jgi:hypothetical protein
MLQIIGKFREKAGVFLPAAILKTAYSGNLWPGVKKASSSLGHLLRRFGFCPQMKRGQTIATYSYPGYNYSRTLIFFRDPALCLYLKNVLCGYF